jgi:hypothetical protein
MGGGSIPAQARRCMGRIWGSASARPETYSSIRTHLFAAMHPPLLETVEDFLSVYPGIRTTRCVPPLVVDVIAAPNAT